MDRPIHIKSMKPHQQGFTACGRKSVKTNNTNHLHHATCYECIRITMVDLSLNEDTNGNV